MYNVGDSIITDTKNITITHVDIHEAVDGTNRTVYKYRCNICGFDSNDLYRGGKHISELWCTPAQLRRNKMCSCCSSKVVKKDINSIMTTHPHLVKYFADKDDAGKYNYLSNKKVNMKCPYCGEEKYMRIADLYNQGFSCPCCSDGLSIGEKIMYIILEDNEIDFIKEYMFDNAKYKYDFYLNKFNMIIETNGKQHYEETTISRGTRCFEDEVLNDKNKKDFALSNDVEKYIYIDCRKSDVEYIINSIYNSGIIDLLHIKNIDVDAIRQKLYSHSIVKNVCDIYSSCDDISIKYLQDMFHMSRCTIRKYLKIGANLGWCDYNSDTYRLTKRYNSKKIYNAA
jgi:hypothetical protein|nr:MAG TPA: restriction enzyme [Caudoviricetes sp.]